MIKQVSVSDAHVVTLVTLGCEPTVLTPNLQQVYLINNKKWRNLSKLYKALHRWWDLLCI